LTKFDEAIVKFLGLIKLQRLIKSVIDIFSYKYSNMSTIL